MIDGDLDKIIKDKIKSGDSFTEAEIVEYMIEISNGVEYCHRHKVVHKDLKPLNILSANGHLKLCDFGIAKFIENSTRINPDYCSEGYAAPEILGGKKFRFKVDIWSIGCILYELCTLKKPFNIRYKPGEVYDTVPLLQYSPELRELISELLEVNNEFRPPINIVASKPNIYIYHIYVERFKELKQIRQMDILQEENENLKETIAELQLKIQEVEQTLEETVAPIMSLPVISDKDDQSIGNAALLEGNYLNKYYIFRSG